MTGTFTACRALVVLCCIEYAVSFRPFAQRASSALEALAMSGISDLQASLFSDGRAIEAQMTDHMSDCHSWIEGDYSGSFEWHEEKMGGNNRDFKEFNPEGR